MRLGLMGGEGSRVRRGDRITMAMAALAVAACGLIAASGAASANPLPSHDYGMPLIVGLGILFLMNLPVNVFWYSTFVLVLSRARVLGFTSVPEPSGDALARKVLGAAICVSAVGAMIDLFAGSDDSVWFKEVGEATVVALALVFASVLVITLAVPRLRIAQSVLLAALMTSMNFVHWTLIAAVFYGDESWDNPAPYIVVYGLVCAVLSVFAYRLLSRVGPPDTSLDIGS